VQVTQAAPVAVAPQPVVAPATPTVIERVIEVEAPVKKEEKKSKIIPSLGASTIKGDRIDFESNLNLAVNLETMVMPQVSVGLGLGYTSLDITDVSNDFVNIGVYNPYPTTGYQNVYGTGRKMSLGKVSIEANSKFFFTEDSKIKPYAGGGLSYNRSNLKYEDGGMYSANGISFGSEGYSSSTLAGTAKLGAEVDFSDTIGFNLDLSYTKNITSGIAKNADTTNVNPDQQRLENITKAIEDADTTAIQAGLVVRF
jgi:outer membrane protein W